MKVEKVVLKPRYKKENGLWVIDIDKVKVPFKIEERSVIYIPPGQLGGNHKHPRKEAFIGIGEGLELIYKEGSQIRRLRMNPKGKTYFFIIPPFLEHAVVNNSKSQQGVLIEFADQSQRDVETCDIV